MEPVLSRCFVLLQHLCPVKEIDLETKFVHFHLLDAIVLNQLPVSFVRSLLQILQSQQGWKKLYYLFLFFEMQSNLLKQVSVSEQMNQLLEQFLQWKQHVPHLFISWRLFLRLQHRMMSGDASVQSTVWKKDQEKSIELIQQLLQETKQKDVVILWTAVRFYEMLAQAYYFDSSLRRMYLQQAYQWIQQCYQQLQQQMNHKVNPLFIKEKLISLLLKVDEQQIDKAMQLAQELIVESKQSGRSLFLYGTIWYRKCHFANALDYFLLALKQNPNNILYSFEVKQLLFAMEKYQSILPPESIPAILKNNSAAKAWKQIVEEFRIQEKRLEAIPQK